LNVLALLSRADEIEHTTTDGVFGDIAGVSYQRERAHIAATGAANDLSPVGVVGLGELREEPLQSAVGGVLHLIRQFDTVRLLSSAEKDLRATNHLTEKFLDSVSSDFQVRFDGLASLNGFRCDGRAVGIERFLSGDVRGDRLA
jgi:hypothetical protein